MKLRSEHFDISCESEVINEKSSFEDGLSSANTEDSLLGSKSSSGTINKSENAVCCPKEEIRRKCRSPKLKIIIGTLLLLWGVCTIIWTPLELMMDERLRMRPGFPAYDWWKSPPDEVLLRVYIFNITNAEKFLSGEDAKLNVQEIGPIMFMEKLTHTNVTFNDNDTMTYVATRKAIFLPDRNHINLNQTITVPNLALLGMASYLSDASFFEKWGFNMMVRSAKSRTMVNMTIHDYLWNFTDPLVNLARKIVPNMVPVDNLGILSRIYDDFENLVTVYIGTQHGDDKYFLIDRYDHSEYLPGHGDTCDDRILNSTEGVAYPQYLTKNSTINYWRKTMCKVTTLLFDNFPMAASFPHFLYGDPELRNYVTGLQPEENKHQSFVYIEPVTGIPLNSRARSQSNLILKKLTGFRIDIEKFSDIVLPMFWAEYNQVGLPWYIAGLMYFTVKVLPILQRIFTIFLLSSGIFLVVVGIKQRIRSKKKFLMENKLMHYEHKSFIKV
ncbi:hypothetical protein WA026_002587 [Henosepilachna vigintioctopunctata]|uniref:Scavenger receptor class B member 1 n=1 Tax=Henosepilachna vigintioctopunctata TaxID=420089 RepID=A0AAW1U239_9CUCU